jgi:hypothetical protein
MIIQVPSLVLPAGYGASPPTATLASTETVADIVEHTSVEFIVRDIQEKSIQIMAMEIVFAGIPGPLNCWVELSPYPSANNNMWPPPLPASAAFWAAIGGGGGALAPVAPYIEIGTGVNLTPHGFTLNWAVNSAWARVVIQTPVAVGTAWWMVQAIYSGKSI